jgi:hypothetical protein
MVIVVAGCAGERPAAPSSPPIDAGRVADAAIVPPDARRAATAAELLARIDVKARVAKLAGGAFVLPNPFGEHFGTGDGIYSLAVTWADGQTWGELMTLEIGPRGAVSWNGRLEVPVELELRVPCALVVRFADDIDNLYSIAERDGELIVATGIGGQRVGRGAVACRSGHWYVVDEQGTCTSDLIAPQPRCGIRTVNGREVFYIDDDQTSIDGDTIGLEGNDPRVKQYPDAAAARAAVTEDLHANDPLWVMRALGGKVGDTRTIPGLIATYLARPNRVLGRRVTVTARYVQTWYGGGRTIILGMADPGTPQLSCSDDDETPPDAEPDDIVTVSGIVEPGDHLDVSWHGIPMRDAPEGPALSQCTIVKRQQATNTPDL